MQASGWVGGFSSVPHEACAACMTEMKKVCLLFFFFFLPVCGGNDHRVCWALGVGVHVRYAARAGARADGWRCLDHVIQGRTPGRRGARGDGQAGRWTG
ncbi:hypothetical protein IWX91DRAFT_335062 [Phyllosticta citricarpa]